MNEQHTALDKWLDDLFKHPLPAVGPGVSSIQEQRRIYKSMSALNVVSFKDSPDAFFSMALLHASHGDGSLLGLCLIDDTRLKLLTRPKLYAIAWIMQNPKKARRGATNKLHEMNFYMNKISSYEVLFGMTTYGAIKQAIKEMCGAEYGDERFDTEKAKIYKALSSDWKDYYEANKARLAATSQKGVPW